MFACAEGIVSNKADVSTSAAVAVINTLYSTTTVCMLIVRSCAQNRRRTLRLSEDTHAGSQLDIGTCHFVVLLYAMASNRDEASLGVAYESGKQSDDCLMLRPSVDFQVPVMIAVDDWNALYWRTGYHEWMNNKHRKRVDAAEVRLVAALRRLMEGPPPPPSDEGVAPCVRLMAAMSRGSSISESLHVPRPRDSVYEVSSVVTRSGYDASALSVASLLVSIFAWPIAGKFHC